MYTNKLIVLWKKPLHFTYMWLQKKSKAGKLEKVNEMIKSWKKQLGNDEKV